MVLKYDLGDKSEYLKTMNHFEKLDKTNRFFFAENARFFEYCAYFGVKDWR